MFSTEVQEDRSFISWVGQMILSTLGPIIMEAMIEFAGEDLGFGAPFLKLMERLTPATLCLFAILLALVTRRVFPRSVAMGRWAWVLPGAMVSFLFVAESLSSSLRGAFTMLFNPGPFGEAGLLQALVTFPAIAAGSYSLTMAVANRRNR